MNTREKQRLLHTAKFVVICGAAAFTVIGVRDTLGEANVTEQTKSEIVSMAIPEKITEEVDMEVAPTEIISTETAPTEAVSQVEYPFNTMSFDWSEEQISGFKEYHLPEEYKQYGGFFPLEMQQFTYVTCEENGVSYELVLAMIEVESAYQWNAESHCGAVGYMQIMEKWHHDRMEKMNINNAENPYFNVMIGVDYLSELLGEYPEALALSIYNRGFRNDSGTGALDLWEAGKTSTSYSTAVLEREEEIKKELEK